MNKRGPSLFLVNAYTLRIHHSFPRVSCSQSLRSCSSCWYYDRSSRPDCSLFLVVMHGQMEPLSCRYRIFRPTHHYITWTRKQITFVQNRLYWRLTGVPTMFWWRQWNAVKETIADVASVSPSLTPFTPKSDHFQISPAVSPEILHHTVWRTLLFIAYSDKRWLYYQFSLYSSPIRFSLGRLGERTFWTWEWEG